MIKNFKRKLGRLKRAAYGFAVNSLEKNSVVPENVELVDLGKSAGGELIKCYGVGSGTKKILFFSAIHGNEVGTVKLAYRLLDWLASNLESFKDFSFFVIPCLNPDGYELAMMNPGYFEGGRLGRFNANNVDLNRNFDTPSFRSESLWRFGKNYSQSEKVFCGNRPASEPEVKALVNLIKQEEIKIVFSFHNAGKDVMSNNNVLAQELTEIYSEKTGFRNVEPGHWQDLKQNGTMAEWSDIEGLSYVEVEGSSRWGSDWRKQKAAIVAVLNYLKA